ncbi:YciI family protein [Caulobacter sp. DWP3-1-3b2]|uniref:YciI family protein n=1 Tax=Caulobacter sp. DWP3-1-3b2 TaxID=2804643 RepID=UPI003CF1A33B
MLYAILCYDAEDMVGSWTQAEDDAVMARLAEVEQALVRKGWLGPVARLLPTTSAVTLRKGRENLVIDGPFAETKEQLLGFHVIECEGLEAAIDVARQLATANASGGALEVRPIGLFRPVAVQVGPSRAMKAAGG